MKKTTILLVLTILITLSAKSQSIESIGTTAGVAGTNQNGNGYVYGVWIQGNKFGAEYHYSISTSHLQINNDLTNVNFSYYIANSFGITYKTAKTLNGSGFVGLGMQSIYSETISTKNNLWQQDYLPYVSFGGTTRLNDIFNLRGEVIIGKVYSIGLGIGMNINRL